MIEMMVELTVVPGNSDAFEPAFAVQAAAVRANEPGNRLYELFKSRTVADSYTLIEIYEDEAALAAHRTSSHMATNRPLTEPFLAAPPVMHIFEVVPHGPVTDRRLARRLTCPVTPPPTIARRRQPVRLRGPETGAEMPRSHVASSKVESLFPGIALGCIRNIFPCFPNGKTLGIGGARHRQPFGTKEEA